MKIIALLSILLLNLSLLAQNLDKQIDSLTWHFSGEKDGERIPIAKRILQIDPNNCEAHEYIVKSYVYLDRFDKAYAYIDSILTIPTLDPKVQIAMTDGLRHMAPRDSAYDAYYFKLLHNCLAYESTKADAAYYLSDTYYDDFIKPYRKKPPAYWEIVQDSAFLYEQDSMMAYIAGITVDSLRKIKIERDAYVTVYPHAADSALKYLEVLASSSSLYRHITQLPIAQLRTHLNLTNTYTLDSSLYNEHYFPEWYFGYLTKDWQQNLTNDLYFGMIKMSLRAVDFFSDQLKALEEPILYKNTEKLTYRIIWLPSFEHPIVFRFEYHENKSFIYFRVGKGMGGYEPEDILFKGETEIKNTEFNSICNILDSIVICDGNAYDYIPMTDGASLIIEKANGSSFCAHRTNMPDDVVVALIQKLSRKYIPKKYKRH